jgi:hypothetical protein
MLGLERKVEQWPPREKITYNPNPKFYGYTRGPDGKMHPKKKPKEDD